MKRVLIIGGSDSGGGAGIQADLKTVTVLGAYGTTVITALTAQNSLGVQGVHPVPTAFVAQEIDSVMQDIGTDALKTGMLLNEEIVKTVSEKIREYKIDRVVVDPVLASKGGFPLLNKEAVGALVSHLLPLALLVTPNIPEAETLTGVALKKPSNLEEAARVFLKRGARNVLIKGGHAPVDWHPKERGIVEDLFYDGKTFRHLPALRIPTKNTHGSGCTLASAIATGLAQGRGLLEATLMAKEFLQEAIKCSFKTGSGIGTLGHLRALPRHDL